MMRIIECLKAINEPVIFCMLVCVFTATQSKAIELDADLENKLTIANIALDKKSNLVYLRVRKEGGNELVTGRIISHISESRESCLFSVNDLFLRFEQQVLVENHSEIFFVAQKKSSPCTYTSDMDSLGEIVGKGIDSEEMFVDILKLLSIALGQPDIQLELANATEYDLAEFTEEAKYTTIQKDKASVITKHYFDEGYVVEITWRLAGKKLLFVEISEGALLFLE
jgi:hypothetical protein